MSQRVWGRKGWGGLSCPCVLQVPVWGPCIHQEVVQIMENNWSPGLWTKSPWNNGSPGVWTAAGAPWDGDNSVTEGFWLWTMYSGPSSSRSTRVQNSSEKNPGDKLPVFAAHWLPSPVCTGSACQLLPGSGAAGPCLEWESLLEEITVSRIRAFFCLFFFSFNLMENIHSSPLPQSWGNLARGCVSSRWGGRGCKAVRMALPSLLWKQPLLVFPFKLFCWKSLKSREKRPFSRQFLWTAWENQELSLWVPAGCWRVPPLPMAGPWARTSPEHGEGVRDVSAPTQRIQFSSFNTSCLRLRGCALITLVLSSRTC